MRSVKDIFQKHDFLWGSATAAYQCEGGWDADGKGMGEWDYFSHTSPLNLNNQDGDVASDFYHRYKEDIDLMVKGNQNTYRFSIAWSRIMPNGTGEINQKGIDFYNRVIDYCLSKGLEPNITLFHYDLPLALAKLGGWLNAKITDYFNEYANVCFDHFSDRVKIWATINEPRYYSYCTNVVGNYPPNRKKDFQSYFQYQYNLMLASAKAIKSFKDKKIDGIIGIVHDNGNVEVDPITLNPEQIFEVADFFYNSLILSPALLGKLPDEMERMIKVFGITLYRDENELEIFKNGKGDYLGLNLYNRQYVKNYVSGETEVFHNNKGSGSKNKEGIRVEGIFESSFDEQVRRNQWGREVNPRVMYTALKEINERYSSPLIMITENGHGIYEKPDQEGYVEDDERIEIFNEFLFYMLKAKDEGINVRGYYHWATMDLYSWINGYEKRYGLVRVDFDNELKRIPKKSFYWYGDFIAQHLKENS
ncbi:TPA: glycoside hydrolase family 1 protein [Enterobacter ludwigii]|uniref:Glycoside hydrolase family 1 protein n=1 Tax=Raoultella planticola TaxID=575 RepID=A0ABU5MC70_RAOPL|nr:MULTISPECIES: glycoside hydrolase family 1 protein [Enterobacteriaceae]QFH72059.1 glycoside hydrolase family 1 protein [Enterobacter sp. E76]HDH1871667.1 glycoside hydrolase family 1 protein [Klebsiella quasipneumoniae subsp. similipneumoniae]HDV9415858.1 glycoside hydrolase family 1 protein [Raoultella ornithinolytica]MBG2619784.1 glycoside hydrolase family 1 protein [Klebsiella michiganensis]MBG2634314.1 glycoside hydrolase family 1 protein [Klebsiella michiganensis]